MHVGMDMCAGALRGMRLRCSWKRTQLGSWEPKAGGSWVLQFFKLKTTSFWQLKKQRKNVFKELDLLN